MYVNAVVNTCVVEPLLDTRSDITLLNGKSWKKLSYGPCIESWKWRNGVSHAHDGAHIGYEACTKSDAEEALKKRYPELFEEGLGRCTKGEVTLLLISNAHPVFCRSRPVPYAALEAVNAELSRLQQMGVIAPVNGPHPLFATRSK
ncbi:unnamed protein product [Haemonchus placei]|uniref:Macro domain-containing protein n=1 Tax=Haemonchus placei TaxID=6290 RepID=A0A0N4X8F4_HAEPC|nr:unnamed protein product [Haemonchus placei]